MSVLTVENAEVTFKVGKGHVKALNGVSLSVEEGETLAVVGESGCGKTTLARCILGLQPHEGTINLSGRVVNGISPHQAENAGIVWQDPYASLDPRWRIGDSVAEPAKISGKTIDLEPLFDSVGLSKDFLRRYPHQMSGGQRQRAAIARAIALHPPLVICDEPTAALDLSIQAQVLNLLKDLQAKEGCAFLYISHDLLTVRYLADRIAVMYLGKIVEIGPTEQVFESPRHPYTKMLLESMLSHERIGELPKINANEMVPAPENVCPFSPRCPKVQQICRESFPPVTREGLREFNCYFPEPD